MQTWEQTYNLPAGGRVSIEQGHGAVRVTGWDQPTVKVTVTGDWQPAEWTVDQDARGLSLSVDAHDLAVYVPVGTPCDIESESGSVTVAATQADVRIECASGAIALRDIAGVQAESGSGAVAIQRAAGKIAVETGSGEIAVSDVSGTVGLETGFGAIRAERVQGASLTVETGNGEVRLAGVAVDRLAAETGGGEMNIALAEVRLSGSYRIETGSGDLLVAVPMHAGINLDAEAGSGTITYRGLELRTVHAEPGELRATLNQGGARLRIEAGNGNVHLVPATAPTEASPEPEVRLLQAVRGDAALASSEQVQRILMMVEQGKLSPAEAEAVLTALDEEETPA